MKRKLGSLTVLCLAVLLSSFHAAEAKNPHDLPPPSDLMGRLFVTGFEAGDTSEIQAMGGGTAPAIATNIVHSGKYSVRFNTTSGTSSIQLKSLDANGNFVNFSATNCYIRFYLYLASMTGDCTLYNASDSSGSLKAAVKLVQSGGSNFLRIEDTTESGTTGTTPILTGQFYCIEVYCPTSASATGQVWLDNASTAEASFTGNYGTNPSANVQIGCLVTGTIDWYIDTVSIDNAARPGPAKIVSLRPNSTFAATSWTNESAAAATFSSVDDLTSRDGHDSDTTYVTATAQQVFACGVETADARGIVGDVLSVTGHIVSRNTGSVTAYAVGLDWNGTVTDLTTLSGSSSYESRFILRTTNGAGTTILPANLSTLRIRCNRTQSQARALRCTMQNIYVEFNPYSVPTFNSQIGTPSLFYPFVLPL